MARDPVPSQEEQTPASGAERRGLRELSERFLGVPLEGSAPRGRPLGGRPAGGPSGSPFSAVPCDLEALRAAARALAKGGEGRQSALEAALAAAGEAVGAQALRLYLVDPQGVPRMRVGLSRWEEIPFLALVLRLEGGPLDRVLQAAEPVLMREGFEVSAPEELADSDEVHCLALPLRAGGRPRGVLLLFRAEPFAAASLLAMREASAGLALVIDYVEAASLEPAGPAAGQPN